MVTNSKPSKGRMSPEPTTWGQATLSRMGDPCNIDLMPVELGSFEVIIGMGWLRRYHAVIVYDEKLVQVPYGNETLT
ncbi:putative reverse transcriptase domain-containing protein, partial [Tanacetum coccineum]